jgi:hypothetical protein
MTRSTFKPHPVIYNVAPLRTEPSARSHRRRIQDKHRLQLCARCLVGGMLALSAVIASSQERFQVGNDGLHWDGSLRTA